MNKGDLPDYINCESKINTHCDFYMHKSCPGTCFFAEDIGGLGIGSTMIAPSKLEDVADDK